MTWTAISSQIQIDRGIVKDWIVPQTAYSPIAIHGEECRETPLLLSYQKCTNMIAHESGRDKGTILDPITLKGNILNALNPKREETCHVQTLSRCLQGCERQTQLELVSLVDEGVSYQYFGQHIVNNKHHPLTTAPVEYERNGETNRFSYPLLHEGTQQADRMHPDVISGSNGNAGIVAITPGPGS